jgi:adenylosuccinate lyase
VERLEEQMRLLFNIPFAAKFGGATGNYNAHHVAYPQIDWRKFGGKFVEENFRFTPLFPYNTNRTLRSFCSIF